MTQNPEPTPAQPTVPMPRVEGEPTVPMPHVAAGPTVPMPQAQTPGQTARAAQPELAAHEAPTIPGRPGAESAAPAPTAPPGTAAHPVPVPQAAPAPRVHQPQPAPAAQHLAARPTPYPGAAFGAQHAGAAPHGAAPHAVQGGAVPPQGGVPLPPHTAGGPQGPRRKRGWVPVVSAAAIAAVLASAGTAGLVTALDGNRTQAASLADVGQTKEDSSRTVPVADSTTENPNWEAVTKAVAPSVVAIQVATGQGEAEGSGVIIDSDGHVLTNNHVVSGAQQVQVTLSDGRIYDADIVGTDPTTDLAVVKIRDAPSDLVAAALGDSDQVSVGEPVLAVGNPLGLANTATTGIVSALDRPVSASGEDSNTSVVTNAIQIDAAVNPGNSGGPLFNAQGEVIGITSSIATLSNGSSQSGSIGLGFAIPANLAKSVGQQLIDSGTAQHAFLGVTLSDATATADGVTRRGAKVEEVTAGSPAANAGIKAGDVIVAIDGDAVGGAESLTGYVREKSADQTVKVTVVRDGKTQEVDVTLAVKAASTGQGSGQDGSGQQGQDGSGQSDPTNPNNLPFPFGNNG